MTARQYALYEITKILHSLIGDIEPVGEVNEDEDRLKNLELLTAVSDSIIREIFQCSAQRAWSKESVALVGKHADKYIKSLKKWNP